VILRSWGQLFSEGTLGKIFFWLSPEEQFFNVLEKMTKMNIFLLGSEHDIFFFNTKNCNHPNMK